MRRGATVLPERKPFSRVGLATPAAFAPEVLEPWRGSVWRTDSCCPARRSLSGCAHSATGRATGRAVSSADAGRRHRLTSGNELRKQPRSALRRARRAPPSRPSLVVARGKPYHARSRIGSISWIRRWWTGSSWGRGAFQHRRRTKGVRLLRWLQQARQAHRCHGPLDRSGGMTLPELRRAWQACSDRPPTRWSQVRGPIEAAWVSAQRLGETFALGLSFSRKITTAFEAGVGRWRFARFGGSAVQVKGFVGGVGRSALSGGGAGAYWVSSDAEHLAMGQGANAGFVSQQVVVTFYKLELKDRKRVA